MQLVSFLKDRTTALIREEDGQDGIEYLLTIGAVTVAVVGAIALAVGTTPFTTVVTQACTEAVQVMDATASC